MRSCTLYALFLESAETSLFAQIYHLAISALWLVQKMTPQSLKMGLDLLGVFKLFVVLFICRPRKRPFLSFFCDLGPGGPRDSCEWGLGSQV